MTNPLNSVICFNSNFIIQSKFPRLLFNPFEITKVPLTTLKMTKKIHTENLYNNQYALETNKRIEIPSILQNDQNNLETFIMIKISPKPFI